VNCLLPLRHILTIIKQRFAIAFFINTSLLETFSAVTVVLASSIYLLTMSISTSIAFRALFILIAVSHLANPPHTVGGKGSRLPTVRVFATPHLATFACSTTLSWLHTNQLKNRNIQAATVDKARCPRWPWRLWWHCWTCVGTRFLCCCCSCCCWCIWFISYPFHIISDNSSCRCRRVGCGCFNTMTLMYMRSST